MVKKVFLSSFVISSLFAVNCDAPSDDIDDLLNCAKSDLLTINPQAKVYTQTIAVPKNRLDPDYYDFLMAKYNEVFLKIKAELALKVAGNIIVNEIAKKNDKSKMPPELVEDFLNKEIERQKRISENRRENGFLDKIMGSLFSEDDGIKMLKPEQEEEIRLRAEQILYSNEFKETMNKNAREEIAGLIPYENFIVVNKNGETELGIVAYTSSKSRELASALAKGYNATNTKNLTQCKSAKDIIKALETNDNKLNKLGLKFFYNEECQPALLAYGMDTYKIEDGITNDYKNSSYAIARALAEKALANFVKSSVYTYTNAQKVTQNIQKAYTTLLKTSKNENASAGKENLINSYSYLEEFFSSNAKMSLNGVEVADKWSKQFDNYGVAGVIMYYSPTSIENAKKESREIKGELYKNKNSNSNSKELKNEINRSKNIEIEDF